MPAPTPTARTVTSRALGRAISAKTVISSTQEPASVRGKTDGSEEQKKPTFVSNSSCTQTFNFCEHVVLNFLSSREDGTPMSHTALCCDGGFKDAAAQN